MDTLTTIRARLTEMQARCDAGIQFATLRGHIDSSKFITTERVIAGECVINDWMERLRELADNCLTPSTDLPALLALVEAMLDHRDRMSTMHNARLAHYLAILDGNGANPTHPSL